MTFHRDGDTRPEVLVPAEVLAQCVAAADYICQTIAACRDRTSNFYGEPELARRAEEAERMARDIAESIRARIS